ncbi:MAG: class I SAM-dependent methyltransferase [Bryobacteraceae bacterium]|nr:class I SAM-dependent methyltransferase [Bryobacteraceae bacterium]
MIACVLLLTLISGETAWKDFATWFAKDGTPGAPAEVLKVYGATLKTRGTAEGEIQARVDGIRKYMAEHPKEALALHFDRMYTWSEAPFTREPSALVKKVAAARTPGRALDIAMGQGRNSVFLAKAGWKVSGYDISAEALRQADAAAKAAGVGLDTKLASHEEYELGEAQWDLIVMSFAFTRISDTAYMAKVRASLKPGGVLLVEGFNGGPRMEANAILKAFLDYRVLLFEDLPDIADWGRAKAPLLRMALEKP